MKARSLFHLIACSAALSLTIAASPVPALSQQSYSYVANTRPPDDFLSLRTAPSATTGRRIAKLPNGTKLEVLQRRADGWFLVRVIPSREEGWVLSARSGATWIECCIVQQAVGPGPARTPYETPRETTAPVQGLQDHRTAQAKLSEQRAKERYSIYTQQQTKQLDQFAQERDRQKAFETELNAIPAEPENEDRIRSLCRTELAERTNANARAEIIGVCNNKLSSVRFKRQQIEPAQKSRAALTELLDKLENMPATPHTVTELTRLSDGNNYRLPALTFPDQNTYYQAIGRRLSQIELAIADELKAQRQKEIDEKFAKADPDLRQFIGAHPEFQTNDAGQRALELLPLLYAAGVALEYCTEQSFFSSYKGPLAEVHRREARLRQLAEFYQVPSTKIEQVYQALAQGRDQLRNVMKRGGEPASRACDDFVAQLSLNKAW